MADFDWIRLSGCILVFGAYVMVLARRGTAIFGLNVLNVFMVASATLSAFCFGTLFGQLPTSFTPEHGDVVSYSILGLLAMAAGIYIGSRGLVGRRSPSVGRGLAIATAGHINQEIGWLTFWVGVAAEVILPFVRGVPTLSTATDCMAALVRIGLCILLVSAFRDGRWARFSAAMAMFGVLSIAGSLASGFTFMRFNALVPLLAIWFVSSGLTVANVLRASVLFPVSGMVVFAASSAWLETRRLIRWGVLDGLPLLQQAREFFAAYLNSVSLPTTESIMNTILVRVDMTEILAAQVRHQPAVEPYAHGGTLLSSLFTLIPRAVWHDKPTVAGGSAFVTQFTGLRWDAATSVGLPYPFELYANGGPLLVIAGLFVIGYGCARLEVRLTRPQKSLGGFWALALVTAVLTEGGQRADVALPALVASGLTAFALGTVIEKFRGNMVSDRQSQAAATQRLPGSMPGVRLDLRRGVVPGR